MQPWPVTLCVLSEAEVLTQHGVDCLKPLTTQNPINSRNEKESPACIAIYFSPATCERHRRFESWTTFSVPCTRNKESSCETHASLPLAVCWYGVWTCNLTAAELRSAIRRKEDSQLDDHIAEACRHI